MCSLVSLCTFILALLPIPHPTQEVFQSVFASRFVSSFIFSVDVFLPLFVDNEALLFYFISSLLYGKKETLRFIEQQCKPPLLPASEPYGLRADTRGRGGGQGRSSLLALKNDQEDDHSPTSNSRRDSLSRLLTELDLGNVCASSSSSSSLSSSRKLNSTRRGKGEEDEEEEEEDDDGGDPAFSLPSQVFGSGAIATFLEILLRTVVFLFGLRWSDEPGSAEVFLSVVERSPHVSSLKNEAHAQTSAVRVVCRSVQVVRGTALMSVHGGMCPGGYRNVYFPHMDVIDASLHRHHLHACMHWRYV